MNLFDKMQSTLANVCNLSTTCYSKFNSPKKLYQIKDVSNAIEELNEDLKIPFSMFISGYKPSEIANKLNLPIGIVKSRIFFAKQHLQHELKTK